MDGTDAAAARAAAGAAEKSVASLSGVTLRYERGALALDDVTLDIRAGEHVCVLGANGSGKSTLAQVLAGLLAPDEGDVSLLGEAVLEDGRVDLAAYGRARRGLGLVFQNPDDQIVTTIVEDDVAFGPENLGLDPNEIERRVRRELDRVAMGPFAKSDPTRLSGGQKQRVAIAGALAMEPRLLVLDEPGALLDVRGRRAIMRVMRRLRAAGTTIVHVTHFMEEALAADRVIVLSEGRVALSGTPEQVFSHAEKICALGLEEPFCARLASRLRARGVDVGWTLDDDALASELAALLAHAPGAAVATGTSAAADAADTAAAAAAAGTSHGDEVAAILADDVSFSYGGEHGRALDHVSLRVSPGASVAIVGQTGSGKSTLARIACALETPDAGRMVVGGIDTARRRDRRRLHGRIGYVMQHPERQLFAETVEKDVAFGPTNLGLPAEEIRRRCAHALELVGLADKADASPFELSGGQQRLCAIAGVLAMRPATLVLDEPTAGLDPRGRAQLARILNDIHARGVTVVRVTHSMEDAAASQQVIMLDRSHITADGRPEEVFAPEGARALEQAGLGLPAPLAWALRLEEAGAPGLGRPLTIEALADAIAARVAPATGAAGATGGHEPGEVG